MNEEVPQASIVRQQVRSSNVESIGYDPANRTLEVAYLAKDGGPPAVYRYAAVPERVWQDVQQVMHVGGSLGAFLYQRVKPHYTYVKVADPAAAGAAAEAVQS